MTDAATATAPGAVNPEPFYATADRFWSQYSRLAGQGARFKGTPLEGEYAQLMQKGATLHKVIDTLHFNIKQALSKVGTVIQDKYQDAAKWLTGAAQSAKGWFGLSGLNGLGILPLVAVAGVAAAVTAMSVWMASGDDLEDKIDGYERLKKSGKSDTEAAAMVQQFSQNSDSGGVLGKLGIPSFSQIGKLALVGIGIYFTGRYFGLWGKKS